MERVEHDRLDEWLAERAAGPPPPAYRVEEPGDAVPSPFGIQAEALRSRGLEPTETGPRFGSASFVVSVDALDTEHLYEVLRGACGLIDERHYSWSGYGDEVEGPGPEGGVLRSWMPHSGLPVLGPGGGIQLIRAGERAYGSLTIRRSEGERESESWRLPGRLTDRLAAIQPEVDVFVELGYFEASAREHQSLLRPVFMFLIEHDPDPEREFDVGWRSVLVEPATDVVGAPPAAGIDLWYEQEGILP